MGTLAGDKPAWGEDWGYGHGNRHCYTDVADIVPSSREGSSGPEESADPRDLPALLFATVLLVLLIIGAAFWWT